MKLKKMLEPPYSTIQIFKLNREEFTKLMDSGRKNDLYILLFYCYGYINGHLERIGEI